MHEKDSREENRTIKSSPIYSSKDAWKKMRENQKRYYQNGKSTYTFKIGDLVHLKKHSIDKMELKWSQITELLNSPQHGQLLLRTT